MVVSLSNQPCRIKPWHDHEILVQRLLSPTVIGFLFKLNPFDEFISQRKHYPSVLVENVNTSGNPSPWCLHFPQNFRDVFSLKHISFITTLSLTSYWMFFGSYYWHNSLALTFRIYSPNNTFKVISNVFKTAHFILKNW